jgi:predicted DNA-binding transcriptional regulator AlpA
MRVDKQQFSLPLTVEKCSPKKRITRTREIPDRLVERMPALDQLLSTRDVERITNRHRCTIYRWVRAGTFPGKRAGGGRGWLRSDVERWLQGSSPNQMGPLMGPPEVSGMS